MTYHDKLLIQYNLQFFANDEGGEKTEEPTAKKIQDSRKEGQVAKSKEISSAGQLLAVFLCLKIFMSFLSERLLGTFNKFWREIDFFATDAFNSITVWQILTDVAIYILITCLPFLAIAFVVAFLTQKAQIKWLVTTKPLTPKLSKLNPINGF